MYEARVFSVQWSKRSQHAHLCPLSQMTAVAPPLDAHRLARPKECPQSGRRTGGLSEHAPVVAEIVTDAMPSSRHVCTAARGASALSQAQRDQLGQLQPGSPPKVCLPCFIVGQKLYGTVQPLVGFEFPRHRGRRQPCVADAVQCWRASQIDSVILCVDNEISKIYQPFESRHCSADARVAHHCSFAEAFEKLDPFCLLSTRRTQQVH